MIMRTMISTSLMAALSSARLLPMLHVIVQNEDSTRQANRLLPMVDQESIKKNMRYTIIIVGAILAGLFVITCVIAVSSPCCFS